MKQVELLTLPLLLAVTWTDFIIGSRLPEQYHYTYVAGICIGAFEVVDENLTNIFVYMQWYAR